MSKLTITSTELAKVENNALNGQQLQFLLKKTPKNHVYQRPAKGGGKWNYVTGVYVKKVLNLMFGWDWSFEVVEHKFDLQVGQAYVLGKLTVRSQGKEIVKMQFGRVDIKFKKQQDQNGNRLPLDIGNDLKAATTDALKKCASELGVASDVYAPNEFKEINIVPTDKMSNDDKHEQIAEMLEIEGLRITEDERLDLIRILEQKEVASYNNALKLLNTKLPQNEQ